MNSKRKIEFERNTIIYEFTEILKEELSLDHEEVLFLFVDGSKGLLSGLTSGTIENKKVSQIFNSLTSNLDNLILIAQNSSKERKVFI